MDSLEEELIALSTSLGSPSKKAVDSSAISIEEEAPHEEDGWLEVGRKNRMVMTRTVSCARKLLRILLSLRQTKTAESPMTRIFGGKFRSTVRVPGQKDSSVIEDWRSLQLDIQVRINWHANDKANLLYLLCSAIR